MIKRLPHGRVSVAPMLDWTDRHCRYFHRLINPEVHLYTEMVTTGALLHGDIDRHMAFNPEESPVALQLGGSNPDDLARCAEMGAKYGYNEINLNCGCPSDRVQSGAFGACLMNDPDLVARCFQAMDKAVDIPVSIKCRIGIDECEELPFLERFIDTLSDSGCENFIIHARKAWLKGLSPKENRDIPPLRYDIVQITKESRPSLFIELNGGISTPVDIDAHLKVFDGVMIGRAAYQNPSILACDVLVNKPVYKPDILKRMAQYIEMQLELNPHITAHSITRHMLGLYQGCKGARFWRRTLSEEARTYNAGRDISELFARAISQIDPRNL